VGLRDELDLADVMGRVVLPVVRALLRPGELDSISLEWTTVRIPGWELPHGDEGGAVFEARRLTAEEAARLPWDVVVRLVVRIQAKGETMIYEIVDADETDDIDLDWHEDELFSRLQDFIAESRFGWGQLRKARPR
jgi:hypothetical protein